MWIVKKLNSRGDTLVEVLFATVVLSIVLAGAYTLSNRATKLNQTSFERTKVSKLLQEQVELIRAGRDSYDQAAPPAAPDSVVWRGVDSNLKGTINNVDTVCTNLPQLGTALSGDNAFHVDVSGGAPTVGNGAVIRDSLYNIWVEAFDGPGYVDVHAFACWEGLDTQAAQRSSVVVRLEDPS